MIRRAHFLAAGAALWLTGCGADPTATNPIATPSTPFGKINHFVVIYLDSHGFDSLYGEYAVPGQWVDGLESASGTSVQVDKTGAPYATLPQVVDASHKPPVPVTAFPADLPNLPFAIEDHVPDAAAIPALVSRYYQEQKQIDSGKMDKFVVAGTTGGLPMGHYHTMKLPLVAKLATTGVVCDQLYHSAFGGPFLNHQWLIAAATPAFPGAPASLTATLDPTTMAVTTDGAVTPDGYAVNTLYGAGSLHPAGTAADELMPALTAPTIGDRLDDATVDWAWYAEGWDDAVAGAPDATFHVEDQPFVYYQRYGEGTPGRAAHLADEKDLLADAAAGTLRPVSFVKPLGKHSERQAEGDLADGEAHLVSLVAALEKGPGWKDTAVIITYADNGGFWDHVNPPKGDRWGPGTRVPAIILSPYAKTGVVDHTRYETVSILATLEHRFGLTPLASRDALATDLGNAFDFTRP